MPLPSWKEWIRSQNQGKDDAVPSRSERTERLESVEESVEAMPASIVDYNHGPNLTPSSTELDWIDRINNVDLESLLEVKGIGPKTGEKIISGRPYASPEGVPVSPTVLEKLKNWADS